MAEPNDKPYSANVDASGDWKPRPDPTLLTASAVQGATDQMRREMAALDERIKDHFEQRAALNDAKIEALQALTEARLKAVENAAAVFETTLERVPSVTDIAVLHLRELHESKFTAIQQQLEERDSRYSIVSSDAKAAVADALAAQKESVYKQDTATQKAIDQQSVLLTGIAQGIGLQVSDLKDRMSRAETAASNATATAATRSTSTGQIIAWIVAVAAVASVVLSSVIAALSHVATNVVGK